MGEGIGSFGEGKRKFIQYGGCVLELFIEGFEFEVFLRVFLARDDKEFGVHADVFHACLTLVSNVQ